MGTLFAGECLGGLLGGRPIRQTRKPETKTHAVQSRITRQAVAMAALRLFVAALGLEDKGQPDFRFGTPPIPGFGGGFGGFSGLEGFRARP